MAVASRWAVLAATASLLLLAGCSGTQPYKDVPQTPATYAPPEPKPYVPAGVEAPELPDLPVLVLPGFEVARPASPTAAPPQTVEAPRLFPSSQFLYETVTETVTDSALGKLPVRSNSTYGVRILATHQVLDGRPVVLAALLGHAGGKLNVTGATTLDPATLAQRDLGDLAWLNACQEKPDTCPKDLRAALPQNGTDRPQVAFPLKLGKRWTDVAYNDGVAGTWECRVDAINTTTLLGGLDVAVQLACDASFPMDLEDGSTFQTGAATLRWRATYSDTMGVLVTETRTAETRLHVEDLDGIRDTVATANRTVRLADVVLASGPEPDMVELYTLLERQGRSIRAILTPSGDFRYSGRAATTELPATDLAWRLTDGMGKVWKEATGPTFNFTIETGSYLLRVEAVHKGKVLAFQERPLVRHLFVDGRADCDDLIVRASPVLEQGGCPIQTFEVRGQAAFLRVYFSGGGFGVSGSVEVHNPQNVSVARGAWGSADNWLTNVAGGTWSIVPKPSTTEGADYRYEIIVIYDALKGSAG